MTLQLITRKSGGGYAENTDNRRTWKIRTTLKCKRKKKSNAELLDKHKVMAAARGATVRWAMTKANERTTPDQLQPNHYATHLLPLPPTSRHPTAPHSYYGY